MIAGLSTLLINLDRSPQRLALMTERLAQLNLPWQRVVAVEGKALDIASDARVSLPLYKARHGKVLNPGEVGCYLSHVKALEIFLAQADAKWALILEDDVHFDADFIEVLGALVAGHTSWDLVRLTGFHSGTPVGKKPVCGQRHLAVMLSRQTSSAAYLVNRHAAVQMLAKLLPMSVPYDHAFDKAWVFGIKARMVTPLPAQIDGQQASTIGGVDTPYKRLPWYQRLSTHAYRTRTELRRLVHGLWQRSLV